MPGRVVSVVVLLCIAAGGLGLYLGTRPPLTETQVIEAGAAIYAAETGGSEADCVGIPAEGAAWIEVRCGDAGEGHTYVFDRSGALIGPQAEPKT